MPTHFVSSRQAISKHVHILLECDLLKQQQHGREIYYQLNSDNRQQVDVWLDQFKAIVEKRFTQLDDVLAKLKQNPNEQGHLDELRS